MNVCVSRFIRPSMKSVVIVGAIPGLMRVLNEELVDWEYPAEL